LYLCICAQLLLFAVSSGIFESACIFPIIYCTRQLNDKLSNPSVSKERPQLRHFAATRYSELSSSQLNTGRHILWAQFIARALHITLRIGGFCKITLVMGTFVFRWYAPTNIEPTGESVIP